MIGDSFNFNPTQMEILRQLVSGLTTPAQVDALLQLARERAEQVRVAAAAAAAAEAQKREQDEAQRKAWDAHYNSPQFRQMMEQNRETAERQRRVGKD